MFTGIIILSISWERNVLLIVVCLMALQGCLATIVPFLSPRVATFLIGGGIGPSFTEAFSKAFLWFFAATFSWLLLNKRLS